MIYKQLKFEALLTNAVRWYSYGKNGWIQVSVQPSFHFYSLKAGNSSLYFSTYKIVGHAFQPAIDQAYNGGAIQS